MDHVVKVDEMKRERGRERERDSGLKWKIENRREIVESIKC